MSDTKLIYTYQKDLHHLPNYIPDELILALYRECIRNNKQFYYSVMYTTQEHKHLFVEHVDKVEIIDEKHDIYFQDDLKFYVLQKETPPYTIIDGDVILDSKLKIGIENVVYERIIKGDQPHTGVMEYILKMIEYLTKYNVKKSFPYWKTFDHSYNLGILHINDNSFVSEFIKEYTKLKNWYKTYVDKVEPKIKKNAVIEMATCTYFLSMFLKVNNFTVGVLNKDNSFTHYYGHNQKVKFLKQIGAFESTLI